MRRIYHILLLVILLWASMPSAMCATPLTMKQLSDSLQAYANFPPCVVRARVRNLRIKNRKVELQTNATLSYLSLSPAQLTALKLKISLWTLGTTDGQVTIYSDGYKLEDLITARYQTRPAKKHYTLPSYTPLVEVSNRPWNADKGLEGMHLAIAPSHGAYYNIRNNAWIWQRATVWTIVEDLFSSELTNQWLVPMLENAGAYIFQPRERDIQTHEKILSLSSANTQGDPIAINIPEAGQYGVYFQTNPDNQNRFADIELIHQGVSTHYRIRTDIGKGVWQWIGQHYFGTSADSNYVVVQGSDVSKIRFGGGMGSISREGETSGHPRWEEGARYWLEYAGWPHSVWDVNESSDDYRDDLQSRGYWINYLTGGSDSNPDQEGLEVPVELFLAVHTDGERDGKDQRLSGTLAIYTDKDKNGNQQLANGVSRIICRDLSDYVQTQICKDMQATIPEPWVRRELRNDAYCEARYPVIPTLLLEMLSHYNLNDMRYGLDPKYQFIITRAIYKGIVRYLHEQSQTSYTIQPLPVQDMQMSLHGKQLSLSWAPTTDSLEVSAKPTYYIVYTRTNNGDWDNGQLCTTTTYTFTPERGTRYDVRVVAGNNGGISFPSETLSAYLAPKGREKGVVLVVNGFHRVSGPTWFKDSTMAGIVPETYEVPYLYSRAYVGNQFEYDRRLQWKSDDDCGLGMCHRDYQDDLMVGNTFDYPVWHGRQLAAANYSYISQSSTTLTTIDSSFLFVDLILGKEQQPFTQNIRTALSDYISKGGRVLLSGDNVSNMPTKDDKRFAEKTLHYTPRTQRASHSGKIRYANHSYSLYTEPNPVVFHTQRPDGITPTTSSYSVARYEDTRISAGVAWKSGKARTLVFSFPIESTTQFDALYRSALEWISQ